MQPYAELTHPAKLLSKPCARTDKTWRRRGRKYQGAGRPELDNAHLIAAIGGVWKRKARQARRGWTALDHATMLEAEARSMGFDQIQDCCVWQHPLWLTRAIAPRKLHHFIVLVLHAYRAGSIGVLCGYEEWCGLLECSRKTVYNYQDQAAELGLIRILPTTQEVPGSGQRKRGRNLIQLGPALLDLLGSGLLENGGGDVGEGQHHGRRRKAQTARKGAKECRREQWGTSWQRHEAQRQRPEDGATGRRHEATAATTQRATARRLP